MISWRYQLSTVGEETLRKSAISFGVSGLDNGVSSFIATPKITIFCPVTTVLPQKAGCFRGFFEMKRRRVLSEILRSRVLGDSAPVMLEQGPTALSVAYRSLCGGLPKGDEVV